MIAGSMVALVTPMDAQGGLDWDSLSKLVDFHLQEGTNAIVAVGTTGESATLDVAEHIEVIKHVVNQVAGRIPVIAGTGGNSTRESVELTRAAKDVGADACLLVTLLQQTDPGRLVPALPPYRRVGCHSANSLQRAGPYGLRHAA